MTTTAGTDRFAVPDGPPKLTPAQLRRAQRQTLDAPRLRYSLLARALFKIMDIGDGRTGTIVKFVMLEYIARVPYRAWELPGAGQAPPAFRAGPASLRQDRPDQS